MSSSLIINDVPVDTSINAQAPGNLIVQTYALCQKMDDETKGFVEHAGNLKKEVWARVNATNNQVAKEKIDTSRMFMNQAYVSAGIFVISIACNAAAAVCSIKSNNLPQGALSNSWSSAGNVVKGLGDAVSGSGQNISSNYFQSTTNLAQVSIDQKTSEVQELLDRKRREEEAHEEDWKQIKQKAEQAKQDVIQKAGQAYTVGR